MSDRLFKFLDRKAKKVRKNYIEGSYNDNRLVDEIVNVYYNKEEGQYDGSSFKILLDIRLKAFRSLEDEKGKEYLPSEREIEARSREYIEWAFTKPMDKYRDVLDYQPVPDHQKWYKNQITSWWTLHKDENLNEIYLKEQQERIASAILDVEDETFDEIISFNERFEDNDSSI